MIENLVIIAPIFTIMFIGFFMGKTTVFGRQRFLGPFTPESTRHISQGMEPLNTPPRIVPYQTDKEYGQFLMEREKVRAESRIKADESKGGE